MAPPRRTVSKQAPEQPPERVAAAIDAFLAEHPQALVLDEGSVLFDMRETKYSLSTEHRHCTLQLWSDERNIVRRVTAGELRHGVLRLTSHRFGQTRSQTLEIVTDRDRRTPRTRETTRKRYLRTLERALQRHVTDWKLESLSTAMDLERSFGPAYARGVLVRGQQAWAVIGVNEEETPAIIDGILTLGILWLHHCREHAGGRRLFQGLKIIAPRGAAALTLSRLAWLNHDAAQWELWELDEKSGEIEQRDAADHGNVLTRIVRVPNEEAARERFASGIDRVLQLVPEGHRSLVEQRLRSATELAFLLHGLEFARIRLKTEDHSFQRTQQITFGAGASETELTESNQDTLTQMLQQLFTRRAADGDARDPLYRMQPERWLESVLRREVATIDERLDAQHVYTQVPAFAASDRAMLDLLSATKDGRLAVIELKADEDLHLALQGLDYWVRVRWHHFENPDPVTGLGEFQRHGYFPGMRLSADAPRLYLVAPALRVHPATERVLSYLSPRVEWTLIGLDERWRQRMKRVWTKQY